MLSIGLNTVRFMDTVSIRRMTVALERLVLRLLPVWTCVMSVVVPL